MGKWYTMKKDWQGKSFGGITLEWNYQNERWEELYLPRYIKKCLHRFGHSHPKRPQDSLHPAPIAKFTRTTPSPPSPDDAPKLDDKVIKRIHKIYGSILWYMRAADVTTFKALNAIGRKQSKATETTRHWANWLLDYLATHPNRKTKF